MSTATVEHFDEKIGLIDPSEHFRPEPWFKKTTSVLRSYNVNDNHPIQARVKQTYLDMHTNQTVDYVRSKIEEWTKFDKFEATIMEALQKLNNLVDKSDPDVDIPNIVHAYQTAERIREQHPDKEWFQLTGLIHDLGKVLVCYDEPQWSVVGDTFPVGCAFADSIVYRETSFKDNPDIHNPKYNTKYGMYTPNCGLENVLMSWGHDEYMYRVLLHNNSKLPPEAHYVIRFHSFYPWHSGGDYMHLCNERDEKMLPLVQEFQKFDLYTKTEAVPDIEALIPYYQTLADKYIPGKLQW